MQDIVDVLERLLEDWCPCLSCVSSALLRVVLGSVTDSPGGSEFRLACGPRLPLSALFMLVGTNSFAAESQQ